MPGFKDRMKAFGKHIKPPTRIKPDPKGCFEATGEHIKPPKRTKPEPKGFVRAIKEHFKPPKRTKPEPKGFVKAMGKPFRCMFQCVKPQKEEDDCPGLPEVKISYADKEIPESLASRSRISLTDSESDGYPAEADLGPRSDSLEGIPEMLEAESLPSLMEKNEEMEAAGKGKDEEKDLGSHDPCPPQAEPNPTPASDSLPQPQVTHAEETISETLVLESISSLTDSSAGLCPIEADPGPRADRVPEPQERRSDEQHVGQEFHGHHSGTILTEADIHLMCQTYLTCSRETKRALADAVASNYLDVFLQHFLNSKETACNEFTYAVFTSPECNLDICMKTLFLKLNEYQIHYSKELPLAKVKALRGIRAIVTEHSSIQKYWLEVHFVTLADVLIQLKEHGTIDKAIAGLITGEVIDILTNLLQRCTACHRFYLRRASAQKDLHPQPPTEA